ncbi:MAG: alkaline phosphatase [Verrucomicrobiae bacterium]|nr:alkaline phosphatase [Verrucomicrobiae bacterium]
MRYELNSRSRRTVAPGIRSDGQPQSRFNLWRKALVSLGALLVVGSLSACRTAHHYHHGDASGQLLPGVKHVLLIGFDGFGAYAWEQAEIPNLKALAARGAISLETRTVLPSSSAANWATHLMGAGTELHGYTEWNSKTSMPPARVVSKYGIFPGIFGLVREAYPTAEMGVLYQWDGIHYVFENGAVNFEKQEQTPESLTTATVRYLTEKKPLFTFVCYDQPDGVGHGEGHDTPQYYDMLKQCDAEFGKLMAALQAADMDRDTLIIIISDHGGINKGHGGKTLREMQTPWVIAGPGIKPGHKINSSVVHYDTAATLARIFGVQPPQVWTGRSVREVFEH